MALTGLLPAVSTELIYIIPDMEKKCRNTLASRCQKLHSQPEVQKKKKKERKMSSKYSCCDLEGSCFIVDKQLCMYRMYLIVK